MGQLSQELQEKDALLLAALQVGGVGSRSRSSGSDVALMGQLSQELQEKDALLLAALQVRRGGVILDLEPDTVLLLAALPQV